MEAIGDFLYTKSDDDGIPYLAVNKCKFVHDRIRQASYSLLKEDERKAKHLAIVRNALSNSGNQNKKNTLYVATHVMQVIELINDNEKTKVIELMLEAALYAKEALAYNEASAYLRAAM